MIDYKWVELFGEAENTTDLYAYGYGSFNSMIKQHVIGALTCDELDKQRVLLNQAVEARFNELMRERQEATHRWLNRSREQLIVSVATPKAAIYEEGAAIGEEEIPE